MEDRGRIALADDVKRLLVNAAQMSIAVTSGFLLCPVVLSIGHSVVHVVRLAAAHIGQT